MCPSLPDPEFGMVQLTGRMIASKAIYNCSRGYRIEGDQERECLLSGMWSGNQPVCSGIVKAHTHRFSMQYHTQQYPIQAYSKINKATFMNLITTQLTLYRKVTFLCV